ncbi:hypothetical protein HZS55_17090 [Halosimplex rubrum]|uniref:Uncharacterized protein n=1 Tax=Halosimplex rubrum TaxID=869889 RepID=A0A7D5P4I0_9EURY|nr:hypothetical protein [Halosimplex rubrum]QLH78901.1 hypothetical protein HZS55_17090 [Halosimplex rubrum]
MNDSNEDVTAEPGINRRRVLRSIGATGATAAGMSGIASAGSREEFSESEVEAVRAEYRDRSSVVAALADETALLETLADADTIDEPSAEAVGIESVGSPESATDMNVTVQPTEDSGDVTPEIVVDGDIDGTTVQIQFEPEGSGALAVVKSDDSSGYDQVYSAADAGCGSDCDDCNCTCVYNNFSTLCDGTYRQIAECHCNDGW